MGSPPLEDLLQRELLKIGHYPDNKYQEFRESAASFVGVDPENIVPGNGSSEIIRLFSEMTLWEGERALIPWPTFGEYEAQSRLFGAEIVKLSLGVEPWNLRSLPGQEGKAFFFCNPNNPTGALIAGREVENLAHRCQDQGTFLLVDEAFIELSDPDQSVACLAPEMEGLVVMRSLTKAFGVPGLRLGFAVTNDKLAEVLNRARIPWSVSSIAAAAAARLLKEADWLKESRKMVASELAWLTQALEELGLKAIKSRVNFILVNVKSSGMTSSELVQRMTEERILVRDCRSFGLGDDYIRVAVRSREENRRLVSALGKVLGCDG
jgi:L-threonine-O-3-phosphate decarboxylase